MCACVDCVLLKKTLEMFLLCIGIFLGACLMWVKLDGGRFEEERESPYRRLDIQEVHTWARFVKCFVCGRFIASDDWAFRHGQLDVSSLRLVHNKPDCNDLSLFREAEEQPLYDRNSPECYKCRKVIKRGEPCLNTLSLPPIYYHTGKCPQ